MKRFPGSVSLVLLIERKTSLNLLASVPVGANWTPSLWDVRPPDQTDPIEVGVFRVLNGAIKTPAKFLESLDSGCSSQSSTLFPSLLVCSGATER